MKAFVTGGTGFIGSHLVEALVENGHQVTCLVRNTIDLRWLTSLPISFVEGDLEDEEALGKGVRGQDYIFHVAGLTKAIGPEDYERVNHHGTQNLVKATLSSNRSVKRFVHFSSLAAVGPSRTPVPAINSEDPHPLTSYGRSKLKAEEFLRQSSNDLPITILRPPTVYGPRDRDLYRFFRVIQKGWVPLVWNGDLLLSLVYVKDLIRASLMVLETPNTIGKVYFISEVTPHTWSEISQTIASALKVSPLTIRIPIPFLYLASLWEEGISRIQKKPSLLSREKFNEFREKYWICDSTKAREEFGFKSSYSLVQGIDETARWYIKQGWL